MNSKTSQSKKIEKALVSKFITQLFEKNYSDANKSLENLIEKKLKNKIKKTHEKCSCEKYGKLKKKKTIKENADDFLASKLDEEDFGDFSDETDPEQEEIDRVFGTNNSQNMEEQPDEED